MKKIWKHYSYAIILIVISIAASFILSLRFDAFHEQHYLKITVSDGDSLWKIADEYSNKHTLSSQEFVRWVQMHNNIDGDHIFAGEKIIIPVNSEAQPSNEFASAAKE